jgi:hypothetical protein
MGIRSDGRKMATVTEGLTVLAELGFQSFKSAFEVVEFGAEVAEVLFELGDASGLGGGGGWLGGEGF